MKIMQARRIVRACDRAEASRVHEQGYLWMRERLWPATRQLVNPDPALAARGWNVLATMDELNGAYGESLKRLHASVECDPTYVLSWFDLGWVSTEVGRVEDARRFYEKALELDPTHEKARTMLGHLGESLPVASLDDPSTCAADALARFDPAEALRILDGHDDLEGHKGRAAAHGASGDAPAALREWQAAAACEGPVTLRHADWYHLADELFDEPPFWEALVQLSPRFTKCVGAVHEGLYASMRAQEEDLDAAFSVTLALMARFHLARTMGDDEAIAALAAAHPDWVELQ